jgi:hypothetical protein
MSDSSNNIKFIYLYRDAGNYKLYGEVIFSNHKDSTVSEIESQIRKHLIDGEYFNPTEWGIVQLRFEEHDEELDHDWHEFEGIEVTSDEITDNRTIKSFIEGISF